MIVDDEDSIITQSCDKFEIVSSVASEKNILEMNTHSKKTVKKNISEIPSDNDFIRWMKK